MPHDVFGQDPGYQIAQIGNLYGTHAARPSAGGVLDGIFYVETDTSSVFQAQGGAWVLIDTLTTADVISVFGRTGVITANTGDYTVSKITGAATAAALTTETTRATTAEGTNAAAIAAETSRATAAEAEIDTDIGEETTRASVAEAAAQAAAEAYTDTAIANATAGIQWFTHAGDPNTAVVALAIGNLCVDTTNGALYIATAADNSHWVAL